MDGSDDFILVEDDEEVSSPEPPLQESVPEPKKVALRERFSRISQGISGQVDAVKDRLKPRIVDVEAEASIDAEDLSLEVDGVHLSLIHI